jgi:hypothetical protein
MNRKSGVAILLLALAVACNHSNNPASAITHIGELHLTNNAVAGWTDGIYDYKLYDGQILMDQMIDGGAVPFIDKCFFDREHGQRQEIGHIGFRTPGSRFP